MGFTSRSYDDCNYILAYASSASNRKSGFQETIQLFNCVNRLIPTSKDVAASYGESLTTIHRSFLVQWTSIMNLSQIPWTGNKPENSVHPSAVVSTGESLNQSCKRHVSPHNTLTHYGASHVRTIQVD
jgi:hypothetical protein